MLGHRPPQGVLAGASTCNIRGEPARVDRGRQRPDGKGGRARAMHDALAGCLRCPAPANRNEGSCSSKFQELHWGRGL